MSLNRKKIYFSFRENYLRMTENIIFKTVKLFLHVKIGIIIQF